MIPTWSVATQDSLMGLVLHEVGHVFGNGHVDGTVMTEKIGKYLESDTLPGQTSRSVDLYSKIDSQIELVPCMECHLSYPPAETFDPIQPIGSAPDSDWVHTFRLLTGKEPSAPLVIRYERLGSPQGSGERSDSTPLFAGHGDTNFYSYGISYYGKIKNLTGTVLLVAVNYNMDGKKSKILALGEGFYPRPIFVSGN